MQQKQTTEQTFNDRLRMALDNFPDCPNNNFGRLTWVVEQLAERGIEVSKESVRRWLLDSMPRKKNLEALSDILDVDEQYLVFGDGETRGAVGPQKDGAINILLGILQIAHITVEIPEPDDELAKLRGVNLRARLGRKLQELHVTGASRTKDGRVHVEISHRAHSVPTLVVLVGDDLSVSLYRVSFTTAMEVGELVGTKVVLEFDADDARFKRLHSFAEL